jgi:hypothetical protein
MLELSMLAVLVFGAVEVLDLLVLLVLWMERLMVQEAEA